MNQILISEKIYVTPELKRKKRIYKIYFFLAVFLVFILSSYYIYAEYDKNKYEDQGREILSSLSQSINSGIEDDTTIKFEENATIVILNEEDPESIVISSTYEDADIEVTDESGEEETVNVQTYVTASGQVYWPVATISIPSIDCTYPILNTWSDELLKIAPCYYHGAEPNQVGNFCIVGHNYRNSKFFSKVPSLQIGDSIFIEDLTQTTLEYQVYDVYTVNPKDTSCTSQLDQLRNGTTEITLITCTNDGSQRVIVKARAIEE